MEHATPTSPWQLAPATTGERSIKGHAWYRDNERLLYVSNPGPRNRQLWVLDAASGDKRPLGVANAGFPAFMPDFASAVDRRRSAASRAVRATTRRGG